jgi:hypothetical protein
MERDLSALYTGLDALSIAHTRQGIFYPWGRPDVSRTGLKQPALSVAEGPVLDERPSAACSTAAVAVVRTGPKPQLGWILAAQSQTHASRRPGRGRITSHASRFTFHASRFMPLHAASSASCPPLCRWHPILANISLSLYVAYTQTYYAGYTSIKYPASSIQQLPNSSTLRYNPLEF